MRTERRADQMREVRLELDFAPYAEGSCLISFGSTRVLCTASVEESVPAWRQGSGKGWVTGEYAMPRTSWRQGAHERDRKADWKVPESDRRLSRARAEDRGRGL